MYVATGDSISAGTNYPTIAWNSLTPSIIRFANTATSGYGCSTINSEYTSVVAPFYNSARDRNVVSIMCGANDGGTPDASYATILLWVAKAKATGYTVIVLTNTSINGMRSDSGGPITGDQWMQELATLIRNGAVANGYTVSDVNANATMGCTGCYANTTYFSDGEHPTVAGQNIISPILKSTLQSLGFY